MGELVAAAADVNVRDDGEATALHWAAELGRHRLVPLLLGVGADRTLVDGEGNTPRDVAVAAGRNRVVRLLDA